MYAAIVLPAFSLQATLRWREDVWAVPAVVVDPTAGEVLERTPPAAAQNIFPGMPATQAMARCAGLRVFPRAPDQEKSLTALLHDVALAHSPFVEDTEAGAAIADGRGLRIGLDWHAFGDQIVRDLRALGVRATVGIAKTPDVALLAACEADPVSVVRATGDYLDPLPVAFLRPPPEILDILHDWGVVTLGDFLRLPKAATIERLGAAAQEMWRVASGRARRPLRLIRPPDSYHEGYDFEYAIETSEPLLFLLRRFVDQLGARLRGKCLVAARMTLRLPLDGSPPYERAFTIPEPTSDADVLFRILETHLEHLSLEAQPVGVRLEIEAGRPARQQFSLFGAALRDPNRFGETLARLGALIGSNKVGFPEMEDTHRPDCLRLHERIPWTLEEPCTATRELLGLPLQRWRPPVPAEVDLHQQRPAQIESSVARGRIHAAQGPYRFSGHWWGPENWRTEEWDVALADGGLFRISRNKDGNWRVEGCYDSVR